MLRRVPRCTASLLLLLSLTAVCADDDEIEIKRFVAAYAIIESQAADPVVPDKAFYEGAIPGLLRRLDPHSVFFDPGQFNQLKKLQDSTQKGFGSVVSILPGRIIVLQTLPGTPSAKSGMAPGDEILAINGYAIDRLDMDQMVQLLTQSRQQPAQLVVRRAGAAGVLQFVLIPEEMQAPSVERVFLLKPGIGYLRVSSFDEKTGAQIKAGIEKLGGANLKGLVLDLRNNPGGLVTAALQTAALFLEPGQKLLSIKGRKVEEQDEKVPPNSVPYTFPVAVLINGKSASASEIVSGALQDHDRAVIVGETSYGKGLVESVFPLREGTGMALTTALYYTPSGRSIQKPFKGAEVALSATASNPNKQSVFHTDKGRVVKGGGGILPDFEVYPERPSQLRAVLEASGYMTLFAIDYFKRHPDIRPDFEVAPELLDEFQFFLSQRNIQPGVGDWSLERDFIRSRLKTEIFNQAFGIEKGDEVEAQRDVIIRKALEAISAK
jgi:carboxyl-terminal processing protease